MRSRSSNTSSPLPPPPPPPSLRSNFLAVNNTYQQDHQTHFIVRITCVRCSHALIHDATHRGPCALNSGIASVGGPPQTQPEGGGTPSLILKGGVGVNRENTLKCEGGKGCSSSCTRENNRTDGQHKTYRGVEVHESNSPFLARGERFQRTWRSPASG
jgi:hypothetical protein